jgi:hypothetical protein
MPLVAERLSITNGKCYFVGRASRPKGGSLSENIEVTKESRSPQTLKKSNLSNLMAEFHIAREKRRGDKALKRAINHKIPL